MVNQSRHGVQGILCRITVPLSVVKKVARLRAEDINESQAEELVNTVDKERAAFIEKYFHMEWPNRSIYHAMINTAFGEDNVIHTVLALKKELDANKQ